MNFKKAFALVILLEALIVPLSIVNYGWTLEGLQAVTRFSGRLSLIIFSIIFLFYNQSFNVRRLLSDKFFLVFAIAHGIHLFELLSFIYFSQRPFAWFRAAGGMIAYAIIFAMPWFQHKFEQKKLTEKQFNRASAVYLFYVWFIFFMTYLPRMRGSLPDVGGYYEEFVVLFGWVSIMMVFKVFQLLASRRNSLKVPS